MLWSWLGGRRIRGWGVGAGRVGFGSLARAVGLVGLVGRVVGWVVGWVGRKEPA